MRIFNQKKVSQKISLWFSYCVRTQTDFKYVFKSEFCC